MSAVAGWYPDPEGDTSRLRYWDGTQWTDNYTPIPTAAPAEDPQVAQAASLYRTAYPCRTGHLRHLLSGVRF